MAENNTTYTQYIQDMIEKAIDGFFYDEHIAHAKMGYKHNELSVTEGVMFYLIINGEKFGVTKMVFTPQSELCLYGYISKSKQLVRLVKYDYMRIIDILVNLYRFCQRPCVFMDGYTKGVNHDNCTMTTLFSLKRLKPLLATVTALRKLL